MLVLAFVFSFFSVLEQKRNKNKKNAKKNKNLFRPMKI